MDSSAVGGFHIQAFTNGGVLVLGGFKQLNHGQADGQHHHSGCGVGHPHRDEPGSNHEAQHQAAGFDPDDADDTQRHAPVKVPALHGDSQDEPAHEQVNRVRSIGSGGTRVVIDSQQRE